MSQNYEDPIFDVLVDHTNHPLTVDEIATQLKDFHYTRQTHSLLRQCFENLDQKFKNVHNVYKYTSDGHPVPALVFTENALEGWVNDTYHRNPETFQAHNYVSSDLNRAHYFDFVGKFYSFLNKTPFLKPYHDSYLFLLAASDRVHEVTKYLMENPEELTKEVNGWTLKMFVDEYGSDEMVRVVNERLMEDQIHSGKDEVVVLKKQLASVNWSLRLQTVVTVISVVASTWLGYTVGQMSC